MNATTTAVVDTVGHMADQEAATVRAQRVSRAKRAGFLDGLAMIVAPLRDKPMRRRVTTSSLGSLHDDLRILEDDARRALHGS